MPLGTGTTPDVIRDLLPPHHVGAELLEARRATVRRRPARRSPGGRPG